jgi:cation transport regulator ChaB
MEGYVNLQAVENLLTDCLFSVRYVNKDHQDTPLEQTDYDNLNLKMQELVHNITTQFPSLFTKDSAHIPNYLEATHIKKTRDKIFIKAVNVFLQYCNKEKKAFNESHLESAHKMATDSIEKLYGVKL